MLPLKEYAMARVFITGSADGLGQMAAQLLIDQGHQVVLHARNDKRANDAIAANPAAQAVVIGDLGSLAQIRFVAEQVNHIGHMDAVIHNAGVGYRETRRIETDDKLPHIFAINTLAPYVLSALIARPERLVFLSSGMHQGIDPELDDITWVSRPWQGSRAYAESKLYDVMLAFAIARRWKNVFSNAVEPGWVPTKMGGPGAPDQLDEGSRTQAWLAVSEDRDALTTGEYFYHMRKRTANPVVYNTELQDSLMKECARLSGVEFPE
jgi:NAD(P)-dependent dehydrogenase (short-subunit alcohol dehydrogenase family)